MRYAFCPVCKGELELRSTGGTERQVCSKCGFVFYQHSRPCAGVFVVRDREVLLVKRAQEPFKGYWDIPGGFLEAGEHPAAGAVREVLEETGLVVEPVELLGLFMDTYGPEQIPTLNVLYLAKAVGGEQRAGSDAAQMHWFRLDALPREIAFAWSADAVRLLRDRMSAQGAPGP